MSIIHDIQLAGLAVDCVGIRQLLVSYSRVMLDGNPVAVLWTCTLPRGHSGAGLACWTLLCYTYSYLSMIDPWSWLTPDSVPTVQSIRPHRHLPCRVRCYSPQEGPGRLLGLP